MIFFVLLQSAVQYSTLNSKLGRFIFFFVFYFMASIYIFFWDAMVSIFLMHKIAHVQKIKANAIYSSNQKLYCKYQNPDVDAASIASEIWR